MSVHFPDAVRFVPANHGDDYDDGDGDRETPSALRNQAPGAVGRSNHKAQPDHSHPHPESVHPVPAAAGCSAARGQVKHAEFHRRTVFAAAHRQDGPPARVSAPEEYRLYECRGADAGNG
ncbi:hypothetical protein L1887_58993 [Cichorium endivia]|nr:hypothetical protein L1887_58993 [Cichorium endivia]